MLDAIAATASLGSRIAASATALALREAKPLAKRSSRDQLHSCRRLATRRTPQAACARFLVARIDSVPRPSASRGLLELLSIFALKVFASEGSSPRFASGTVPLSLQPPRSSRSHRRLPAQPRRSPKVQSPAVSSGARERLITGPATAPRISASSLWLASALGYASTL